MKRYPPSEDDVLETFRCWLNANRPANYAVASRPDETERTTPAIDFILQDPDTRHEIAVEVSSLWRSGEAGSEDAYWNDWQGRVCELLAEDVPGDFLVFTSLQVPRGISPGTFATALRELLCRDLDQIRQSNDDYESNICGMRIGVADSTMPRRGVSFARRVPSTVLDTLPAFLLAVLNKKSPKLKRHKKEEGRETWLVLYNTVWPLMSPREVSRVVASALGLEHGHIDHVGVVAMNPPNDAAVNVVR